VSPRRHSAKEPLPSVPDLALDKAYFKNKKNLGRVPDHGHSAKRVYIALVIPSFSLTLSHAAPPRHRRARAHAARARPTHTLTVRPQPPQPRPRRMTCPAVLALTVPSPCPRRVLAVRALIVPSPCPCRAPAASPATHRLVRDPSIRPRPVVPPVGYD
jgi:hypothetical protein